MMVNIPDTGLDLELLPGFTKITEEATGKVVYFCRRCQSLDELDTPYCSCVGYQVLGFAFLLGFVIVPAVAVAIKLLK